MEAQRAISIKNSIYKTLILELQSPGSPTSRLYWAFYWQKHRFGSSRAREARLAVSNKNSFYKSIDFGPPELWKPDESFLLRIKLTEASIQELQSSGGPTGQFY